MKSIFVSKETLLKCIRLTPPSNAFSRNNLIGLTCITKVRLVLSHLCDHKFTHNFQGTPNLFVMTYPKLKCQQMIYSTALHIEMKYLTLLNKKYKYYQLKDNWLFFYRNLFYKNSSFDYVTNTFIVNSTAEYILVTKRFAGLFLMHVVSKNATWPLNSLSSIN